MKANVLRAILFLGFGLLTLVHGVVLVMGSDQPGPPGALPPRVQGLGTVFFGLLLTAYGLRLALTARRRRPRPTG